MGCIWRQQNNEIFYTSTNGEIIQPNEEVNFGANIVSNTYEDGKGIILFDADVTTIGKNAFEDNDCLSTISLPNSITTIGHSAFNDCYNLSEVVLSTKLDSIGDYAFYDCNLKEIRIPGSVKSVSRYAFDCSSLSAFYGKLASDDNRCLIINGELVAFAPHGISDYTIPQSVNAIGRSVFHGCDITSIEIPDGVTIIKNGAFSNCRKLHSVILPSTLTTIESVAFSSCTNLTSIDLPNSLNYIGSQAFSYCSKLNHVIIPDGITTIRKQTFAGCSSLSDIKIPNSVTDFEDSVFRSTALKKLILPIATRVIKYGTFSDCDNLIDIEIPSSVRIIEDSAFSDCDNLTSVNIPNSVARIEYLAFGGCDNLYIVKIGTGCMEIDGCAFYHSDNLSRIYLYPTNPPFVEGWYFLLIPNDCKLYVPRSSFSSYIEYFSRYSDQIYPM